jgi:hypothetical protein
VLLLPFIKELWLELLLAVGFWLVLPTFFVWQGKPMWAAVSYALWAMLFIGLAYISFSVSERPHHPNRDAPIIASFLFLIWCVGALVSSFFAMSLVLGRRFDDALKALSNEKLDSQ